MLTRKNIRLEELVAVANQNKKFFEYFLSFLKENKVGSLKDFIFLKEEDGYKLVLEFLEHKLPKNLFLYDGVMSPYAENKGKWFLLSWILRDAPAQRLNPLLKEASGDNLNQRKANLLNELRIDASKIFPEDASWTWFAIREVFIDRLEGSRRAKKGALFEVIVRELLEKIFKEQKLKLKINKSEIKIQDETYDVSVIGNSSTLLIPVKTRETMGGGHAHIFTRDIRESISVASKSGYKVFPIIIAESWTGNIKGLDTKNTIHIKNNPNQIDEVKDLLLESLKEKVAIFKSLN